jgi:zinc transporter, ZIP family
VYYVGGLLIERMPGGHAADGGGLPLLLGAVLDGIPESIVLGLTLVAGGPSLAILAAIFISNVPESVAGSTRMLESGRRPAWIIGAWTLVACAGAIAAAIGYGLLATASGDVIAFIDAFAAGAIITLLANDLFPEAHAESNKLVGLAVAAGFAVAALLSINA